MLPPRGKRRVRMHLKDSGLPSIEGVLLGQRKGHYVLAVPKLVRAEDQTIPLESRWLEVPREGVAFFEVIS